MKKWFSKWIMTQQQYASLYKGDFHFLHTSVWSLFKEKKSERKFLFRVEKRKEEVWILVQSDYPVEKIPKLGSLLSKEINFNLKKGVTYQINMLANPIKEIVVPGKSNSRKIALIKEKEIADWFTLRMEKKGFKVKVVKVGPSKKDWSDVKKGFCLSTNDIQALVEVQDVNLADTVISMGLGDSKAYGCGMVLATPIVVTSCNNEEDIND